MLVTVKQLMSAMGITPTLESDLKGTLTSVIVQAELKAEEILNSPLFKKIGKDVFYVDSDLLCGIFPANTVRLKLSRKFVVPATEDPILVTSNSRVLASDEFLVDREKGLLTIKSGPDVDRTEVVVEYTSGFLDGDGIPERLKQALFKLSAMIAASNQTGENAEGQANAKDAGKLAYDSLSVYTLPVGFYFTPSVSEQADA